MRHRTRELATDVLALSAILCAWLWVADWIGI